MKIPNVARKQQLFGSVLNLVSIAAIGFMGVSLVARHLGTQGKPGLQLRLGQDVPVHDVDWHKSAHTLVFALSVGCRFCAESAPFYKALLGNHESGDWQAVALFPQELSAAKKYMKGHDYDIPEVRQVDLNRIGVNGTPTLLLVDSKGRLEQLWIGELTPVDEADVALHLGIHDWHSQPTDVQQAHETVGVGAGGESPVVTTAELLRLLKNAETFNLLDVRDRASFAQSHVASALNIPAEELMVRAPHELMLDAPTVLYCNFSAYCAANGIGSLCTGATRQLKDLGLTRVRVIRDPVALLRSAGVDTIEQKNEP